MCAWFTFVFAPASSDRIQCAGFAEPNHAMTRLVTVEWFGNVVGASPVRFARAECWFSSPRARARHERVDHVTVTVVPTWLPLVQVGRVEFLGAHARMERGDDCDG